MAGMVKMVEVIMEDMMTCARSFDSLVFSPSLPSTFARRQEESEMYFVLERERRNGQRERQSEMEKSEGGGRLQGRL